VFEKFETVQELAQSAAKAFDLSCFTEYLANFIRIATPYDSERLGVPVGAGVFKSCYLNGYVEGMGSIARFKKELLQ